MSWITDAFNTVTNWVNDNIVKPTYNIIVKPTYNQAYDWATSEQMKSILENAEKVGVQIEDGFITGANSIYSGLGDTIKEKVNEGWNESTKYISENACQLGTSMLVTSTVGALLTAEKELDFRYRLVEIIVQSGTNGLDFKKKSMFEFSKDVSKVIITVVYGIPGMPGSKDESEDMVSFFIYKSLMDENTNISSLKNLWSGALSCGITSYICEGSMPVGYSDWKKGIY